MPATKNDSSSAAENNACEATGAPASHYGWVHVAIAAAAMVATLPGRTHGLGLVTEPLLGELQLDRGLFADMNFWATLLGAAFCLPCGWWIDRFGARRVLTGVVIALGVVVAAMSRVQTWPLLFVAVLLTRGLGQSMLSVASLALVGKSFARNLNVAMGVYSLLVGLGFALCFKPVGACVLKYGWRETWCGIGLVLLAVMAPIAWFLVRGDKLAGASRGNAALPSDDVATGYTLGQALRSASFWIFAMTSSFYGMISSSISLFNEAILNERGFDAATYHTLGAIGFAAGIVFNLLGGLAASRVALNRLMAAAMFVLAASLWAFPHVESLPQVYAYSIALGGAGGIVTVCFFIVWGQAFGQAQLGRIQGAAQLMTVLASAFGPVLAAWCQRSTLSYAPMFYWIAPAAALLGLAAWLVPLPEPARPAGDLNELSAILAQEH